MIQTKLRDFWAKVGNAKATSRESGYLYMGLGLGLFLGIGGNPDHWGYVKMLKLVFVVILLYFGLRKIDRPL